MSKLEELIDEKRKALSRAKQRMTSRTLHLYEIESYEREVASLINLIADLQSLTSSHREEIEALERKAWECSVEMMNEFDFNEKEANRLKDGRYSAIAVAYKFCALKLRIALNFPKSETPERFKN